MEKKYLGMSKNVCFGLGYLFPIVTIILLIADKELTTEEKQLALATVFVAIFSSITAGLYGIYSIICAIMYFKGDFSFKCRGPWDLACLIIK